MDSSFQRRNKEYGTDIYVIAYRFCHEEWKKDIVVSILDGFLGAIWNEKIIVRVGDITISKDTLDELIETYKDYLIDYTENYYRVLVSTETHWIERDLLGYGMVRLGILIGDADSPKRVAMIRQTGMKIMDKDHLPGHVPCVGVMFIEGNKINEKLREMENPEHTLWQPERAKNPIAARELIKVINRFIREEIEKIVSTGNEEEIDAVGIGNFLPDISEGDEDLSKEETVSDKVVEVEVKRRVKKTEYGELTGNINSDETEEIKGSKEPGGDDKEWFHGNGKIDKHISRPPQSAHLEPFGDKGILSKKTVSLINFCPICLNKKEGDYVLSITPHEDVENGFIELFLSAETQNYEAPLCSASIIGGKSLTVDRNKIANIQLRKNKSTRLKIKLNYFDTCAMEVRVYAIKE